MNTPLVRTLAPVALAILGLSGMARADHHVDDNAFRVCADPNNLPFSNQAGEGVENRIASLWAERLGQPLEYEWFPQRRGFERMTLRSQNPANRSGYKCDVVVGVAKGWELGITTQSYYRSTWALAYLEGGKLDGAQTPQDIINLPAELKETVSAATFIGTPASVWLSRHGLDYKLRPYQALDADPNRYPGQLIENDLRAGEVDLVILWGPVAGYFANRVNTASDAPKVVVIPMESGNGLTFDFTIASGVRYGDGKRREQISNLLRETQSEVTALLTEYGFPLLPIGEEREEDDDDDD
ncbi:MAG: quinoprotein dehydrogenase-associated putative ABC transporter substrate-binding protein [Pseudomonadota bacterium]